MNLGDGLLFELENGKPKLILLSHGAAKNQAKLSCRPRVANILSSRQPSCVEEAQGEERPARQPAGRHRETRSKAGGAAASSTSSSAGAGRRSAALTSSKTHELHKGGCVRGVAKGKSDKQKHSTAGKANGKAAQPTDSGTRAGGLKDALPSGDAGLGDSVVCLTSEQLQQILSTAQTANNGQDPPEDPSTQGHQADPKSGSSVTDGAGGKVKGGDKGGGKEIRSGGGEGETDTTGGSQDGDNRSSGRLFSWLEERQSESRAAVDARKAQWRRELDEQVALKQQQQRSAPARLQAEEDAESVLSVQSSTGHREQPPAIRSSLRLGEVTPMEEACSVERREEQKRRWLEELDQQREEVTERRRREKLLQSQTENHELWASHFDSLQRRPPAAPSAAPPAPSNCSERGEWEPSSSLSLVWEAMSSCGAESVGGASVETTSGYPARANYLRTMTALLDPTQIEERERRRLKQLEQQRAIEAQIEERQRQREREEARRREEEERDERRLALEREMLERRYEVDALKERQKEQLSRQAEQTDRDRGDEARRERPERGDGTRPGESSDDVGSSASPYKDTAVQTEAAPSLPLRPDRVQTPHVPAQYQPPPPPLSAAPPPPNSRNRAPRTGKENICLPGGRPGGRGGAGEDPYEAFARTDRSRRDKRRPEWNTQRPSRQFVPASERYPASLQRNRQESRMRRQAELIALQERTCLSRTNPPQNQDSRLFSNPTQTRTSPARKVENVCGGHSSSAAISTERGRSPPVPAVRHRAQSQQAPPSSALPPPVLEFVPYVRTDEVFSLDPLEPADTPPPHAHTGEAPPQSSASPPAPSHRDPLLHPELLRNAHTHRQQEILRGLAQLRQGLLQKQRELETDLNPLLKRRDNELR